MQRIYPLGVNISADETPGCVPRNARNSKSGSEVPNMFVFSRHCYHSPEHCGSIPRSLYNQWKNWKKKFHSFLWKRSSAVTRQKRSSMSHSTVANHFVLFCFAISWYVCPGPPHWPIKYPKALFSWRRKKKTRYEDSFTTLVECPTFRHHLHQTSKNTKKAKTNFDWRWISLYPVFPLLFWVRFQIQTPMGKSFNFILIIFCYFVLNTFHR